MPAFILRFIPLLVVGVGVWFVLRAISREIGGGTRERNGQTTFKPRWRPNSSSSASEHAPSGQAHVMSRAQLHGLRDALTSAPIDPDLPLQCCGKCRSVYHQSSVDALNQEHGGACVNCGSTDLGAVHATG